MDIDTYNKSLPEGIQQICLKLMGIISKLPAQAKVWHGSPVWFIDGNPVVGYSNRKDTVQLLFWSGQSFTQPGLKPIGKFKAAEIRFKDISEIDETRINNWLREAQTTQWDYKNIVKRRGKLIKGAPAETI